MGGKTTTQSNEPWGAAKPALQTTLTDAGKLYEQGIGGRSWTGPTNAAMTMQQTGGLSHMMNTAQGFQPWLNTGANRLDNVSNAGTRDANMAQGSAAMSAAVGGYGAPSTGMIDHVASQSQGPSFSQANLSKIASGSMLGGGDPYFERAMEAASRKAGDAINMSASGAGRYGSAVHQGNLAREIGDMQATARSNQYNTERGRQVEANSLIDSMRGQGLDRALSAYGTSAGIQGQNADRRIGAANNLFGMGQQGVNNQLASFDRMGTAYDNALRPGQTSLDVGQRYQDQAQNVLNDQMRIFDDTQNLPWQQLSRYNAIASGMGGLGGTQTARSGGGFGDVLGGLMGILGGLG